MKGLESLDFFNPKSNKPSRIQMVHYLFWEKGIELNNIYKLPLPYIFGVLKSLTYVKEKEEEEYNKIKNKK